MPILNKDFKKKQEKRLRKYDNKKNNLNHKAVYNTDTWRKLRLLFLQENPLCKRCLEKGKLRSAVEVHHIEEIDNGKTLIEKRTLGFDWNNLEGLCTECHTEHHNNKRKMKYRNGTVR